MDTLQKRALRIRIMRIVGVLLVGVAVVSCSQPPTTPLTEEEFLKLLVEAARQGPVRFKQHTWPLLEKKMIIYCGRADEIRVEDTGAVVLITVEKTQAGEKIPWRLEGKTNSPDLARLHQPGEPLCMTGTIESFTERLDQYWGYVKMVSLEKPPAS